MGWGEGPKVDHCQNSLPTQFSPAWEGEVGRGPVTRDPLYCQLCVNSPSSNRQPPTLPGLIEFLPPPRAPGLEG